MTQNIVLEIEVYFSIFKKREHKPIKNIKVVRILQSVLITKNMSSINSELILIMYFNCTIFTGSLDKKIIANLALSLKILLVGLSSMVVVC